MVALPQLECATDHVVPDRIDRSCWADAVAYWSRARIVGIGWDMDDSRTLGLVTSGLELASLSALR